MGGGGGGGGGVNQCRSKQKGRKERKAAMDCLPLDKSSGPPAAFSAVKELTGSVVSSFSPCAFKLYFQPHGTAVTKVRLREPNSKKRAEE